MKGGFGGKGPLFPLGDMVLQVINTSKTEQANLFLVKEDDFVLALQIFVTYKGP